MNIPDLPVSIQNEIQKFITQYDYLNKTEPIRDNIFEILDEKCIILYYPQDEENDGSLICKYIDGKLVNFVHINTYKVIEKQVFTAAHELAHILELHDYLLKKCSDYNDEIEEAAMNYFAALVLMPTQIFQEKATDLFKEFSDTIKIDDFIKISLNLMDIFFVPFKAVVVRLFEINIIDKSTAEFLINNNDILKKINDYINYYGFTRLGIRSQKKGIKGFPELISKVENANIFNKNKIDKTREKLDIPLNNISENNEVKLINLELKNGQ